MIFSDDFAPKIEFNDQPRDYQRLTPSNGPQNITNPPQQRILSPLKMLSTNSQPVGIMNMKFGKNHMRNQVREISALGQKIFMDWQGERWKEKQKKSMKK